MPKIALLDATVSDQIAAGEVVERPSSVVKELVENALDAGALRLRVEVEQAGKGLIRVSDDGEGMDRADLELSVLRHATSKIRTSADLLGLSSFGFRGEALPSIASVSRLKITTRVRDAEEAWALEVDGGHVGGPSPCARPRGTTVEVRGLFFNTPARLKFLKSDSTETARMQGELSRMALARPDVGFQLLFDGQASLDLAPSVHGRERLRQLWGASMADAALEVAHVESGVALRGWVAPPALSRGQRGGQWLFVNGRVVEHRQVGFHLSQAFGSLLPHGRHAVAALFLDIPLDELDVNVHPAKREVRFTREARVLDCLRHGVVQALLKAELFAKVELRLGGWENASAAAPAHAVHEGPSGGHGVYNGVGNPVGDGAAMRLESSLLPRTVETAMPSHMQASPWPLPVTVPSRADWPMPLAQLHRSYLLCQDSQGLVVVDQHAAHERVLYERQLRAFAQGGVRSQRLLLPQRLQVQNDQAVRLDAWLEPLAQLGLELENVGGGLFFVSALPEFMKQVQASALLLDLLEGDVERQPLSGDPAEDIRREAAASMACRAAIKAGDSMVWESMQQLMADLASCDIPWCCPHGRPPLVRLTLADLEKHFQRR